MEQMEQLQKDLQTMRTIVQRMGWTEFMGHVAGLPAEQSDKTSGSQSSALFACSNTVSALRKAWEGCGRFQYPADMVKEEEVWRWKTYSGVIVRTELNGDPTVTR